MAIRLKEYTIVDGDTVQSIAQSALGDASLWPEIAILNNLDYPFIAGLWEGTDYEGTIKYPGDTILIPVDVVTENSARTIEDNSEELLYGVDLKLTGDFMDGKELTADEYGDLATASGLDCLYQDLINRLFTPLGSVPYHPEYGSNFYDIIGRKKDVNWKNKVIIEISKTFKSDPRVVNVTDITVREISQGIQFYCTVVTTTKRVPMTFST